MLDLSGGPVGMRLIVRKERPHAGAQLRFTDIDGHLVTCFATRQGRAPGPSSGPVKMIWRSGQDVDWQVRSSATRPRQKACRESPWRCLARWLERGQR
jgi:hypothetical protein